ncbi:MAG: Gfo/Idh/MocA family protein [Methyloligellaceae bacterium]
MLRSAIIGLGWWGRELIHRLEDNDRIQIVCGMDVNAGAAQAFMEGRSLPLLSSYQDVLARDDVDAVILTTPNGFHEEQVIAAAEANKQVFCEKPLTLTKAAAVRMINACEKAGLTLGIGHERRFDGALVRLKSMIDEGELGTLLHLEFNASYNLFMGQEQVGWRYDPKQAPAGMMTGLGVHMTDYMQTLAGRVKTVSSHSAHRSADYTSDDILANHFTFESGATATFTTLATTPFYQRLSVFGDRAWGEIREVSNVDKLDPAELIWRGMDEEIHTRTYKWRDTVSENMNAWADAVQGRGDYPFTHPQILHNVEILEAIVQSIDGGVPVHIKDL